MPDTMVQITLPEMGESVTEGSIVEWRKKVGDFVAEGDPLVEVTTDKVDVEVPATASGVIKQILVSEGATVGVGAVLAEIDTSGTSDGAPVAKVSEPVQTREPKIVTITLPEMGESVTEGSIVEWQKHAGDFVNEGDPIVSVTTDKVDVEVPAIASGVILKIVAAEGARVAVGAPLAQIDANASVPAAAPKSAPQPAKTNGASVSPTAAAVTAGDVNATAQARRIARKMQIDLHRVKGSGPQGLVLRSDVDSQGPALRQDRDGSARTAQPQLPPLSVEAKVTHSRGRLRR